MSVVLPVLYHWSPATNRPRIRRRGLRPTTPTWAPVGPPMPGGARVVERDEDEGTQLCVCLGTSPSHAWSLSGAICARLGQRWDLWQVTIDDGDAVFPMPFYGHRLDEFRVGNPIPYRRLWLVGTRHVKGPWTVLEPDT